jgi:ribosomal protein L11 methyltransferase
MNAGWLRLQFRVDASYFDSLSDVLEACLALSVSIENDGDDEFFEVAFPGKPTWKKIRVSALFHDDVDSQSIIDFVNNTLFPKQPAPTIVERMQDQDWVRVWLDKYQPIHISNDLWVVPSWLDAPNPLAKNLCIDPGLAFGTGTHATTFLCLEWIANHQFNSSDKVIDYGAGSGILAIAALLQGCSNAVAVDIDPLAVQAAAENAELNGVSKKMVSQISTDYESVEKFQLVIANILAEVLIEHAAFLFGLMEEEGILLLSGILVSQREIVQQAFLKCGNTNISFIEKDGWLMLIIEKL